VRDAFITTEGQRATIAVVGKEWLLVHYPNGDETPRLRTTILDWTPAPPPLITDDVTLYLYRGHICSWKLGGPGDPALVLHQNGTWTWGVAA
jgi:hypothetical protein